MNLTIYKYLKVFKRAGNPYPVNRNQYKRLGLTSVNVGLIHVGRADAYHSRVLVHLAEHRGPVRS